MAVPKIKVSPALKKKLAEIDQMVEDAVERKMTDGLGLLFWPLL